MTDALVHRGPDDGGVFSTDGVALGSRRLAIIDLTAAGHQPLASADGQLQLVYNGEIYNYRELRRELETHGARVPQRHRHRGRPRRVRASGATDCVRALQRHVGVRALGRAQAASCSARATDSA